MINKSLGLAIVSLAAFLSFPALAETLSVHGSTTVSSAILDAHKDAIQKETGLTLDIVANGSGNGLTDLVQGKADVAMLSSDVAAVAAKINAKTPNTVDVSTLKAVEIAKTHAAFCVHPSNPVKALTTVQMADILSGKVVNWKEVGGEDKPILVATEIPTGGLRTEVEKTLLGGKPIAANKRELVNGTMIAKIVSQMPDALGVTGAGFVTSSIREVTLDKVDVMTLYYVTKGDPSPAAQKLIDATIKVAKK